MSCKHFFVCSHKSMRRTVIDRQIRNQIPNEGEERFHRHLRCIFNSSMLAPRNMMHVAYVKPPIEIECKLK